MNGNNNYKSFTTTFKELLLVSILLILTYSILSILTNAPARMAEYNRHMCIDVYGLNEECK